MGRLLLLFITPESSSRLLVCLTSCSQVNNKHGYMNTCRRTLCELKLKFRTQTHKSASRRFALQTQSWVFRAVLHFGDGNLLKSCACKRCPTSNTCTMGWLSRDHTKTCALKFQRQTKVKVEIFWTLSAAARGRSGQTPLHRKTLGQLRKRFLPPTTRTHLSPASSRSSPLRAFYSKRLRVRRCACVTSVITDT